MPSCARATRPCWGAEFIEEDRSSIVAVFIEIFLPRGSVWFCPTHWVRVGRASGLGVWVVRRGAVPR